MALPRIVFFIGTLNVLFIMTGAGSAEVKDKPHLLQLTMLT